MLSLTFFLLRIKTIINRIIKFISCERRLYTWRSPDDQSEIRLIIFFAAKDGEVLYSQNKIRLEVDCGSDHELLIAKFKLTLKKVGKISRPFRHDLSKSIMIIQWK